MFWISLDHVFGEEMGNNNVTPCNYLNGELDRISVSVEGVSGMPLHGDQLRHCVLV